MAEARRRDEWSRAVAVLTPLCLLANAKLKPGARPFRAAEFSPFAADGRRRRRRNLGGGSAAFRPVITGGEMAAMFGAKKKPKP